LATPAQLLYFTLLMLFGQ